jgi:ribulose-phosphate 3-epimerase
MKPTIAPSIITSSQKKLTEIINQIKPYAKHIHLDIMDGTFVKNKSLWFDFKLPKFKGVYEAHLMVKNPDAWITKHGKKVNTIIVHHESCKNLKETIKSIEKLKKKPAVAYNPQTPVKEVKTNHILIMAVHPGKYGARFLPNTIKKVRAIRKKHPKLNIEVDGNENPQHAKLMHKAGANIFVSGSYIFKKKLQPKEARKELRKSLT